MFHPGSGAGGSPEDKTPPGRAGQRIPAFPHVLCPGKPEGSCSFFVSHPEMKPFKERSSWDVDSGQTSPVPGRLQRICVYKLSSPLAQRGGNTQKKEMQCAASRVELLFLGQVGHTRAKGLAGGAWSPLNLDFTASFYLKMFKTLSMLGASFSLKVRLKKVRESSSLITTT